MNFLGKTASVLNHNVDVMRPQDGQMRVFPVRGETSKCFLGSELELAVQASYISI